MLAVLALAAVVLQNPHYAFEGPPRTVSPGVVDVEGWCRADYSPDGALIAAAWSAGDDVFLRLFDAAWNEVVPTQVVAPGAPGARAEPELAWSADGAHLLVVGARRLHPRLAGAAAFGQVFARSGAPVTGALLLFPGSLGSTSATARPQALSAGGWAVVATAGWSEDVLLTTVLPDGSLPVSDRLVHPPSSAPQRSGALTELADGSLLVAWNELAVATPGDIRARRLTAAGLPLGPPFAVSGAGSQGLPWLSESPLGVVAFVWLDGGPNGDVKGRDLPGFLPHHYGQGAGWTPRVGFDVLGNKLVAFENTESGLLQVLVQYASGLQEDGGVLPLGPLSGPADWRAPGLAIGRGSASDRVVLTYARHGAGSGNMDAMAQELRYHP